MTEAFEVTPRSNSIQIERLKSGIERIERLAEERKTLSQDITDIFKELKSAGFEPKVIREVLKLRNMDPAELEERDAILDVYRNALGL